MSGNSLDRQQDGPGAAELPQDTGNVSPPRPGDLRRGVILAVSPQGLTVDIGLSQPGVVPSQDLEKLSPRERESLRQGVEILVYVTGIQEAGAAVRLSRYLAMKEEDWLAAEDLQRREALWEGQVTGYNKGGLVVPFGHIRGFVPASQVTGITRNLSGEARLARLGQFVGQRLAFKVVDVNRRQRRLILSERLGRTLQRSRQQEAVLTELRKGEIVRGRVRALTDYGAFLDLGSLVGLIHRTELAWFRVEHPVEIVQEGQEVEALVLRVNRERERVSLSLKRTYPDPWPTVMERYVLGQLVEGRVIRRTGAGLFLLLTDGVLGFIPQSDVGQSACADAELAVGRRLLARLVRIDGARQRLGLSLRRVEPAEWAEWRSRAARLFPPEEPAEKTSGAEAHAPDDGWQTPEQSPGEPAAEPAAASVPPAATEEVAFPAAEDAPASDLAAAAVPPAGPESAADSGPAASMAQDRPLDQIGEPPSAEADPATPEG